MKFESAKGTSENALQKGSDGTAKQIQYSVAQTINP
jgi:hypothetical protein